MCEDPRVRIQGQPNERWLEPIVRACEDLRAMHDRDATARVRIVPAGRDLIVEITLLDGRSTLRRVTVPERLRPTLEALLTVPPSSPPQPAPPPPEASPPPAPSTSRVDPTATREFPPGPKQPPATPAQRTFGVEIGGTLGARIAGQQGYFSFSPAGFAQLKLGDWLFGMLARWDTFQKKGGSVPASFEMETLGIGLSIARRVRTSFGYFDGGVSPRLVVESQSYTPDAVEIAGSSTDIRVGAFGRLVFGTTAWRFLVEADAELSPSRLRRDIRIDPALPALPSWSAGLGIGLMWAQE